MFKIKNIALVIGMLVVACEPAVALQINWKVHDDLIALAFMIVFAIGFYVFIYMLERLIKAFKGKPPPTDYESVKDQFAKYEFAKRESVTIVITPKAGMNLTVNGANIKVTNNAKN